MSEKVETVIDIQVEKQRAQQEVRELRAHVHDLHLLLGQTLSLMRRMGVGENVIGAYSRIQSLITSVNALRAAIFALEAGAGPIGWLMLGIGGVSMALTLEPSLITKEMSTEMDGVRSR